MDGVDYTLEVVKPHLVPPLLLLPIADVDIVVVYQVQVFDVLLEELFRGRHYVCGGFELGF